MESSKSKRSEVFILLLADGASAPDRLNLKFFWFKDESLEDSADLADPDIIAAEIAEDLQAALAQFAEIANDVKR
jgi:type I restriction enzyme M protein